MPKKTLDGCLLEDFEISIIFKKLAKKKLRMDVFLSISKILQFSKNLQKKPKNKSKTLELSKILQFSKNLPKKTLDGCLLENFENSIIFKKLGKKKLWMDVFLIFRKFYNFQKTCPKKKTLNRCLLEYFKNSTIFKTLAKKITLDGCLLEYFESSTIFKKLAKKKSFGWMSS